MDYAKHYDLLIARAKGRTVEGYTERHHIVPRCMGGTDEKENLVDLTGEEHYVAHQLLVRMYPHSRGLIAAAVRMSRQCSGSRAYGWLRRRHAETSRKAMIGNKYAVIRSEAHRRRLSEAHIGLKQSPESIQKRALAMRGRTVSKEVRAKIGAKNKGKYVGMKRGPRSPEHTAKLVAARVGMQFSQEWRSRISKTLTGRKLTPEHRANIAAGGLGRKRTPEAIEKTASARRGMKHTPEARAKMSAALRGKNVVRIPKNTGRR